MVVRLFGLLLVGLVLAPSDVVALTIDANVTGAVLEKKGKSSNVQDSQFHAGVGVDVGSEKGRCI